MQTLPKLITILFLLSITNFAFAQIRNYPKVSARFRTSYNAKEYDTLFNSFSKELKHDLPIEKTWQFLSTLRDQAGAIDSMEFTVQNEGYMVYRTKFEKAVLAVNISLNDQDQINGLFIKPYEKTAERKNNSMNALSTYPKEIADLIFTAAKDLPNNAQLSIAILQKGNTNFYGIEKSNDTIRTTQNQDKIFEIGSITKVFTATVLASLVEEKKIKLSDDINKYYPFSFKDDVKLSFLNLANHTSGLPRLPENLNVSNSLNPYKTYGKNELEHYLQNMLKLDHRATPAYSYSNLGAGLLAYTLGLSQKSNFQDLLQKMVFDKYKMTSSFTSSANLETQLIRGLNKNGEVTPNWDMDALFGAGGVLSSSADLIKFATAQFNAKNKELELTRATSFDIKGDSKIGLGWHKTTSANQEEVVWHNGGTGGYSSSIVMKVKEKKAVIILCNVADSNDKIDALSFSLLTLP